jgi:hypothetical protein
MNPVELFSKWAGDHDWSDWAKPTLFAQADQKFGDRSFAGVNELTNDAINLIDGGSLRSASPGMGESRTAIVVDAPGEVAVAIGALMAQRGFVPVPVFNGVWSKDSPLVDNAPIINALEKMADKVRPAEGPQSPVFLLDSRRLEGAPAPGRYDNRWIVFPQDFPSGGRLIAGGIRDCLILASPRRIQDDLSHVLKRWQDAGITMYQAWDEKKQAVTIATPPWYRHVFYRVAALSGLRPNSYGAFGALIPVPTSSSGYG